MREIAEAAGLGKSTLYDYFRTKDEILLYFFEDEINDLTESAQKIVAQALPADVRLRGVVKVHFEYLQANKHLLMRLSVEALRLKLESQKQIQKKRHAYQDLMRNLIAEGVREGVFRRVDPLVAARMLINTLTPVIYTSRPSGTPQEMMEETLDIFLKGLQT